MPPLTTLFTNDKRTNWLALPSDVWPFPSKSAIPDEDDLRALYMSIYRVSLDDGPAVARSARLWESLLEKYPKVPFLLITVADMRWKLGAQIAALELYKKLEEVLSLPALEKWLAHYKRQHAIPVTVYKNNHDKFYDPRQLWRSTMENDPLNMALSVKYPDQEAVERLRTQPALQHIPDLADKYRNFMCIHSNAIETTVTLTGAAVTRLVNVGFYDERSAIEDDEVILECSDVTNGADALLLLRDTHQALRDAQAFSTSPVIKLTMDTLCELHKTLMTSSQIGFRGYTDDENGPTLKLNYTHIGRIREGFKMNVTAGSSLVKFKGIQFCPYDSVTKELMWFCGQFNVLLSRPNVDPFAACAWIHHVFVTIHPFQDGNGRLARIIGSIPLLRAGLPPLSIPNTHKLNYLDALNRIRADRHSETSYLHLMQTMFQGMDSSFTLLGACLP
ncbi:fido domain-containing protein [Cristinia sonorae]|uniref:Fido domain-containing protein n=1 Tax=Cristinia sonorae TaxID=1940300 RepID=A0A8K0XKG0_9AGAR|nr:fido domain-containing protein [Cristinia sonorae]